MNNLARLNENLSRLDTAEGLMREALRLRSMVIGGDHPGRLMTVDSLGMLLQRTRQWDEAEEMSLSALTGR